MDTGSTPEHLFFDRLDDDSVENVQQHRCGRRVDSFGEEDIGGEYCEGQQGGQVFGVVYVDQSAHEMQLRWSPDRDWNILWSGRSKLEVH